MRLRASSSGCPNFAEIDRISVELKILEVAKNARKSFDKKASFVFVCSLLCLLLGVNNSQLISNMKPVSFHHLSTIANIVQVKLKI